MKNTLAKANRILNGNFNAYSIIVQNLNVIPTEELKVLLALSHFMPNAYPSIETLSTMTGKSERTVLRHIKKLEELCLIKVERRHRQSSIYTLLLGDTAMSLKDDFRVTNNEFRVTSGVSLGDTRVSVQHINKHINKKRENEILEENNQEIESPEQRLEWIKNQFNKLY
jgi:AraC-like DNA-binding protein